MSILTGSFIAATRQHHAVEHATINILNRRHPYLRLVGWSTNQGFHIHGSISADQVRDAAAEAIARLQRGETHLAVHPRCGTNLVTSGTLVGLVAFLTMLPGDKRSRQERLPLVLLLSTLATLLAQPLGLWVQSYVTTDPDIDPGLIPQVTSTPIGQSQIHHVQLVRLVED